MSVAPRHCLALLPVALVIQSAFADPPPAPAPSDTDGPVQTAQADTSAASSTPSAVAGGTQATTSLEGVTVTAQRRSQDVKDVPISISVIDDSAIQSLHVNNYDDLSRLTPGLSFNSQSAAEGTDNISIRGVSSTAGSATVGLYLDDVSITTKNFYDGAPQPILFDIDRIEVLKGPQGTLFGASSEGGTIRFITPTPDMKEFSASVIGDISGTQHASVNGMGGFIANVPVNPDVFALRLSLSEGYNSGYIDHYAPDGTSEEPGVNSDRYQTLHVSGKLTPGGGLTILPSIYYQTYHSSDNDAFYPQLGLFNQDKKVQEWSTDTLFLPSLTVKQTLPFADLTSVTGYFQRQFNRQEDGTYYNSTLFAEAFLDPLYPAYQPLNDSIIGTLKSPVEYDTRTQQISEEIRLSSREDEGPRDLHWVGGLYYSQQDIHNTDFQQIPGINQAFQSIYGFPMEQSLVETAYGVPGTNFPLFPNSVDEADNRTYKETQYAIFGQTDYDLSKVWHLGLGGRYQWMRESFVSNEYGFYQIGNIDPYNQDASFNSFTPKATLTYDVNSDSVLYGSVGKGIRFGGPTGPLAFGPTAACAGDFAAIGQTVQPTKFGTDSLWSYELGSKNTIGKSGVLNAAVFDTSWTNIQQQIYLPTCGYYFTSNVGDARIYGAEVEGAWKFTDSLKATLTASAQSATITSTKNPETVQVGAHLIDVPRMTATLGVNYSRPWTDTYLWVTRADYEFTGHSYGSYQVTNSNYSNPGYGLLNLSTALVSERYEFTLYVKNAFNNHTIIQRPEINTVVEAYTVRPITVGLTARANF